MLHEYLKGVEDKRRGQARQYGLAGVLVCVILALLSNAKSYRQMAKFGSGQAPTDLVVLYV